MAEPSRAAPSPLPPGKHWVGSGGGVTAREVICRHGARSPAQCGQTAQARVGLLLGGVFQARTTLGEATLSPGALLTNNAGDSYEFRHVDDGGDRTLSFELSEGLLDEAARSLGGPARFTATSAPAAASALHVFAHARAALAARSPELLRETALLAVAHALAAPRAGRATSASSTAVPLVSLRRVARALRYLEAHAAGDCSLETLAAVAKVSPFHLVRTCRAATGQTPHQLVVAMRLSAAERLLRATNKPVTEVALDAGFGDLTNFAASFRRAFGLAPRAYRARHR